MRQAPSRSPVRRVLIGLLLAALCAPAPVWAADEIDETAETAETDAETAETDAEADAEAPAPIEQHWYDPLARNFDIGVDLLLIRPAAAITAATGAVLFVPAALMTSPNGMDSIKDAYERFVREPGEYFYSRPLGEF